MQGYAEPKYELVKTVYYTPVHDAENDYALRAVRQKVGHPENNEAYNLLRHRQYSSCRATRVEFKQRIIMTKIKKL